MEAARRSASAKSTSAAFALRPFFAGCAAPEPAQVDDVLLEVSVCAPPAAEAEFAPTEDVTVRGAARTGSDWGPPGAGAER
jgi:hypothetical protein